MVNGTIYFNNKKNCYMAQLSLPNGKRASFYQHKEESKTEFQKRITNEKSKIIQGLYVEKSKKTIKIILLDYFENQLKINEISERTYVRDLQTLKQLEKVSGNLINIPIQKITVQQIRSILPNLIIYANSSIDKIYRLIKKAFDIAYSDKLIQYNIMQNIGLKKPKSQIKEKKVEALTLEEQKKLEDVLNSTNSKYNDILLLQLFTGMRMGEVLGLKRGDINLKENTICIQRTVTQDKYNKPILGDSTKTKKSTRTISMNAKARKIVERILKNTLFNTKNLLFYNSNNTENGLYSVTSVNSYLKRINKKYNICDNIHTHMLRHSFATRCIEAGMNSKVIQEYLGHEDITTTLNTYTTAFNSFKNTELEKLDKYLEA